MRDFLMLSALFLTRLLWSPWLAILDQFQIVRINEVVAALFLGWQSTFLNKLVDTANSHS